MTLPISVDLHDTHRCPCGIVCQVCGYETARPVVTTVSTLLGVFCVTACPACLASGEAPPIPLSNAVRLVLSHCIHLGIDADEMADAMATSAAMAEIPAPREALDPDREIQVHNAAAGPGESW